MQLNSELEKEFHELMIDVYRQVTREVRGYRPKEFLHMVTMQGGLSAAKDLINASAASYGFSRLFEAHRLDLSVEATVLGHAKFHILFTDAELARARDRLSEYGYAA
jgi:hypothetical protein